MYMPGSKWTWSFMLIALFQCLISSALEAYVFAKFESSVTDSSRELDPPPSQTLTIPTYLAIFIFGFVYQLVLVWDALRLMNTIQVIGVCIYNVGMLIYASVEMNQVDTAIGVLQSRNLIYAGTYEALRPYLIAGPCIIALGTVLLSGVAWKLYREFAWTIYQQISADLALTRRYRTYQIYIALLKFDFFFFLGFTIQFLVVVEGTTAAEFWLTVAAIPITVALLFLAAFFTRRESYAGQTCIIIVYFAAAAYFVFKLVRMYASSASRQLEYMPARRSLTTFAVLTLLLLIVTIVIAFICMRNFNKGLGPHIRKR
ncbi:hypothetical protein BAUCODRAFT_52176, partial [Baudoinia panamericana UAMH 10762]